MRSTPVTRSVTSYLSRPHSLSSCIARWLETNLDLWETGAPQVDLSKDEEAAVADDNLHGQQLAVEHVIQKVFKKYAITIKVPDKIRHAFQSTVFPRIVSAESILFRSCQLRLLNEGGY